MAATRKKMGRPTMPEQRRLITIHATVTPRQKAWLEQRADELGISFAAMMRIVLKRAMKNRQ
jgi:hypothetical protein